MRGIIDMTRERLLAGAALIALGAGFAAAPAIAQQQSAQAQTAQAQTGLEEIVVTARKREENLVDIPLSISAFTEEFIEKSGIDNIVDVANQTPGFSFRQAFGRVGSGQGGGSSNRPAMRGQSNIVGTPNVGFFVDGIFVSGNITTYQLDNVERIEVIRGPQAALFGRGTFAGAVNFITRRPGNEFGGKVEVTAGVNDHYEVNGYVNGALVEDKLAGELSARYYTFGGDWFNRATGKKDGGEESSRNVGGKLLFSPSDTFEVETNFGWSRDVDGTFASNYTGINCLLPTITATVPFPRALNRTRGYFCGEAETADTFFSRWDILDNLGLDGVNRNTWRASAKATYDINDWTVTGIAAFNRFRNLNSFDSSYEQGEASLRPTGLSANEDRRKDWSVEGRVNSPAEARIRGLAGVYYYREDDEEGFRGSFTLPAAPAPIPLGSRVVTLTRNPTQNDSAVRNWSVFGLLEFDATDDLTFTAEARYQTDTIISDQLIENATNPLLKDKFKKLLPRATMLYKINENWNLFANVAEGNKPGGFNSLAADADDASRANFIANFQTYEEESAWTYELGIKGSNENRTLTIDTSAYWIDWSDQQLTSTFIYTRASPPAATPSITSTAILNAGATRIRGLEVDLNAKPTEAFDFRFVYTYLDARIRDFIDPETEDLYDTDGRVGPFNLAPRDPNGQTRGQYVPQNPSHKFTVTAGLTQPLSGEWNGFLRSDLTYESKRYAQVHNLAHTGDSYIMNVRAGVENDDLTVTLFVNNALDDRTPTSLTRLFNFGRLISLPARDNPALRQTSFFRDILAGYPRKRAFGVTANYKF